MNFTQVRSFIAAAECENFTRAAERLYLSQPVLSRHISTMEDELSLKLFKREKKSVHLTPVGKIMYESMVKLMREYNMTVENALASQNAIKLNIGFSEGQLFSHPFAAPIQSFRAANPDIQINLNQHNLHNLKNAILHREIDVALVAKYKGLDEERELAYIEVGATPMVMVMPVGHRLACKKNIGFEDIRDETLVVLSDKESLVESSKLADSLIAADIAHKTITVPDIGAFALTIAAGFGIATINNNHSLQYNPNLRFIPIAGVDDFIETVLWRRDNANPAIKLLIKEFQHMTA
ncbi:MAG: LysR family transcriptional regulator [Clostridiales Family XIII bacterium]|jgi:DNA-binding transcriptional LysR family regulator|nr:LysR family transcriptional regulator [Clostridiales Family XIII bacterium]